MLAARKATPATVGRNIVAINVLTAIDTSLWSTCYSWDCTNRANPELQWFQPSQVTQAGGVLSLTAEKQESHGQPYISGMISSEPSFRFTYGYAQIVAKLPRGKGLWSGFWTASPTGVWPPEIDVMENWAQSDSVNFVVHYNTTDREVASLTIPSVSTRFHTYAVDWEPDSLTWYVDGVRRAHYRISISIPQYLLATLNVASNPPPDAKVRFPQSFQIRSIQVWQHPGVGTSSSAG